MCNCVDYFKESMKISQSINVNYRTLICFSQLNDRIFGTKYKESVDNLYFDLLIENDRLN